MEEAVYIIANHTPDPEPQGFMVSFEWVEGGMLRSDHFPDRRAGEILIVSEKLAWEMATDFAAAMERKVVNVYVTKQDHVPVDRYREKILLTNKR